VSDVSFAHEPEPPSSESLDALTRDRQQRRNRILIGGSGAVVLIGAALLGVFKYQDAAANAHIAAAWSGFGKCLLGTDLEAGELASARFRTIQLTAMTLPEGQRASAGGQPWPIRCAGPAHAVGEALRDAGRAEKDKKDLAHYVEEVAKQLKVGSSFSADLSESLDSAWAEAKATKIPAAPAGDMAGPPIASIALTVDALAKTTAITKTSFSLRAASVEPHAGQAFRILVEEKGVPNAPFLCTFAAAQGPARCATLPEAIRSMPVGLRLLGTADDDAAPLVFAGNRGDGGTFRSDTGELVARMYSYGGYSTKDGYSAVLGWNDANKELVLTRKSKGPSESRSLKPDFRVGNFFYSSQILWDQILLRGVTKDQQRRLFAQRAARGESTVGAPIDIGELEEPGFVSGGADEPPHIVGCRAADTLVVRVKGSANDFMAFYAGGQWSQPVSPQFTGGTLSCRRGEATVTRLEPAPSDAAWRTSITQARCTSAGCQRASVRLEQLLAGMLQFAPRENHVDAVELDGKLLVVWAAGERGGVRMRFASADKIATAPDVVIFDDLVKDGRPQKLSTLFDLRLFSRDGVAILLLATVSGVYALRITPDGKIAPAPIQWG
jgi:hypothetical protein